MATIITALIFRWYVQVAISIFLSCMAWDPASLCSIGELMTYDRKPNVWRQRTGHYRRANKPYKHPDALKCLYLDWIDKGFDRPLLCSHCNVGQDLADSFKLSFVADSFLFMITRCNVEQELADSLSFYSMQASFVLCCIGFCVQKEAFRLIDSSQRHAMALTSNHTDNQCYIARNIVVFLGAHCRIIQPLRWLSEVIRS